ncbi:hypothetical protein DYB34_001049 [Aphanomyces astaci]|uniref:EGF-like domain-containing protein n=1 Tax=Aphanomyces astaci TaxID=112090 RepID=A0A3R6WBA3_APHAT|nr:hypothetical protein DYB34_001049 [Aphanomyces astaci]
MYIKVNGKEVACPLAGGDVSVPGFQGTVRCPAGNKICQLLQTQCSGQGILMVDGSCSCNPGYGGSDCSLKDCPLNGGIECNGRGTCDRRVGTCQCEAAYTGLSCSELLCPVVTNDKSLGEQCSGNGAGFFGAKCDSTGYAPTATLELDTTTATTGQVSAKTYSYFKVLLNSSSSDITVLLTSSSGDADLYGSFVDKYPSPKSTKTTLFVSNANRKDRLDAIQLCGTLGKFPRAINDTFRFCSQANSLLVQGAPGYFYIGVFGFAASTFQINVVSDPCVNELCSNHGTCGKASAMVASSGGLRNTTDCYGNGECRVLTVNGIEQPTCICDEAFSFENPTDDQSICKVPLPSISHIQHYADPFVVYGDSLQYYVPVGEWTIYTLTVKPEWQYVYVHLRELSDGSDPLVLVRKTKLPSLNTSSPYPLQAADAAAWTSAATSQRVLLTRASSTLSDGLLYIGVYNTRYGRNPLAYQLTVEANSTCDVKTASVCGTNAVACAVALPTLCQCASTSQGPFCDQVNVTHRSVKAGVSTELGSLVAVREGNWQVRPLEPGFPSLDLSSAYDFNAVTSSKGGKHTVLVPVTTSCAGPHCYKVAVHNKLYSGNVLQANVTLVGLQSAADAYAVPDCTISGVGDTEYVTLDISLYI